MTEELDGEGLGFVVRGDGETLSFLHAGGNMGYRAFMIMHVATGDGAVFMTRQALLELKFEVQRRQW